MTTWKRYTVTEYHLRLDKKWAKRRSHAGLTEAEMRSLVSAPAKCIHEGLCMFPFETCDAGATYMIEEADAKGDPAV